jgi:hypothetical protein
MQYYAMHCSAFKESCDMKNAQTNWRENSRLARRAWGELSQEQLRQLRSLTVKYRLSVASGDLQFLDGRWYVTHTGLLGIAQRRKCAGINAVIVKSLSDASVGRWVFRATVQKSTGSAGFVGYGDADPSNVSSLVRGAEMRVAETRAVNRALRKAYGIGLCSVEELGSLSTPLPSSVGSAQPHRFHAASSSTNGHHPRLRDQLCLLIRQHGLDSTLVKAYAADFCGTQTLKDAGRDLVESFIDHLTKAAKENRDALVCKLNSYAQPAEANP